VGAALTLLTILQHPPLRGRDCLPQHCYDGGRRQVALLVAVLTALSARGEREGGPLATGVSSELF
jgi:hypothetical protein